MKTTIMYQIEDQKYSRAKERVAALKRFYGKVISAIGVVTLLAAINYYTNEWQYAWFLWAAFGLGIGLFFRAIKLFGANPFLGKSWEERKMQEFMNEDAQKQRGQ